MNIYLTRHGLTDWNLHHKCQGRTDIALNAEGLRQASGAADYLQDEGIIPDAVFTSPLARAYKTAQIIAARFDAGLVIDDRLIERNFGKYEGMSLDNFDIDLMWYMNFKDDKSGIETMSHCIERAYSFLDELTENPEYERKTIVIVSHFGMSIPLSLYPHINIGNGSLKTHGIKNCQIKKII